MKLQTAQDERELNNSVQLTFLKTISMAVEQNEAVHKPPVTRLSIISNNNFKEPEEKNVEKVLDIPPDQKNLNKFICRGKVGWMAFLTIGGAAILVIMLVNFCITVNGPMTRKDYAMAIINSTMKNYTKSGNLNVYPSGIHEEDFKLINDTYTIFLDKGEQYFNKLVSDMENDLKPYITASRASATSPYVNCFVDTPEKNQACGFYLDWLGPDCTKDNKFGYKAEGDTINPCFLLKIEEAKSWTPLLVPKEDLFTTETYDPDYFGVVCRSKTPLDDNFESIDMNPPRGFPVHFFPQSHFDSSLYMPPAVMVQLRGLKRHVNTTITCTVQVWNAFELLNDGSVFINFYNL